MDAIERYRLAGLTDDQRLEYEERVAICIEDGGLSEAEAKDVAWAHVRPDAARGQPRPTPCEQF